MAVQENMFKRLYDDGQYCFVDCGNGVVRERATGHTFTRVSLVNYAKEQDIKVGKMEIEPDPNAPKPKAKVKAEPKVEPKAEPVAEEKPKGMFKRKTKDKAED